MRPRIICVALAVGALLAPPARASDTVEVDPFEGVINGQRAISFYPVEMGSPKPQLVDPTGFTAHLVPDRNPDREDVLPAGEWLILEEGRYTVWMEGPDRISPRPRVLTYTPEFGNDPQPRGMVSGDELVPAGTVALAEGAELADDQSLRLLSTGSHLTYDWVEREFSRRLPRAVAHRGALMPAGEVIVAVHDAETNTFSALTRPLPVEGAATTRVDPEPPADGYSHLMVRFERPAMEMDKARHDLAPVLIAGDDEAREPDVMVHAVKRCFAWWYDVHAANGRIEVASDYLQAQPVDVVLPSGQVVFVNVDLAEKPSLGVDLILPPELEGGRAKIAVTSVSDGSLLRELELEQPFEPGYDFEALPLEILRVTLSLPPWAFSETVDLTDGQDGRVIFDPEGALVHGTVFVGDEGAPARVGFMVAAGSGERFAETDTDPNGDYEILLFPEALGPLTSVTVLDPSREPEIEFLAMSVSQIRDGTVIDFELADNAIAVTAVDADTGLPVPGADVRARQARTGSNWNRRFVTDDQGTVVLPPIPLDTELVLEARAEGYRRAEPVTLHITADTAQEQTTLMLEPERDTGEILLMLPDGEPAAGARVAMFQAVDARWSWEGSADQQGKVEVPDRLSGGWLAGTHDRGGWLLERWTGEAGETTTMAFPSRGDPLSAKVVTPGGDPVPFARLRVWLEDLRLGDPLLAWLTRGSGSGGVDREGFWVCRNAPRENVQVLAWSPHDSELDPRAIAGEYDYLKTTLSYPWLGWKEVEVIMR